MLAYLAVESSRPHRREQLAALFWPGWPDASARTSLRNALSNLRKAIGDETAEPPFLLITRETIQFNPESSYLLDTLEFEQLTKDSHATADQLQSALDLYRGASWKASPSRTARLSTTGRCIVKSSSRRRLRCCLSRLAELYEQTKPTKKPSVVPGSASTLEPWQEDAHRQLMRLLAAQRSALGSLGTVRGLQAQP